MRNDVANLIKMIDQKIHTLTAAKQILLDAQRTAQAAVGLGPGRGRKGPYPLPPAPEPKPRRRLSPEARKRIAAAQKKRWAVYRAARANGAAKSAAV